MAKRSQQTPAHVDFGRAVPVEKTGSTLTDDFRDTFSSPAGARVRDFLLNELHVMNPDIQTDEERILRNFGMRFLTWCGSYDPGDPKSLKGFARALFKGSYTALTAREAHNSFPEQEE